MQIHHLRNSFKVIVISDTIYNSDPIETLIEIVNTIDVSLKNNNNEPCLRIGRTNDKYKGNLLVIIPYINNINREFLKTSTIQPIQV